MAKQIKCILVKLSEIADISQLAIKVKDFNGNTAIIPKSQVFGYEGGDDYEACWVSEWILKQKHITFSHKHEAWFNTSTRKLSSQSKRVTHCTPAKLDPVESNLIESLKR